MGYGERIDQVVGTMSRLLHIRPAKENTVGDLGPYYDLPAKELFPEPSPIDHVEKRRTLIDRAIGASTLTWRSSHEPLCPRYRKRHVGEYRANLHAHMRWVRPERTMRRSCLIYVHGWLEPGSWAEETTLFRKWAKDLDVDLVHVSLPFHGLRKPKSSLFSGEFFWTADLVRSLEGVRQAIYDVRATMAFMRAQGYEEIGVTGISLGGALVMMLACLEPTPDYAIPIIAHLELSAAVEEAPILWRMKHDLAKWGIPQEERAKLFARLGLASFTPVLPAPRQLWIQAREDVYIDPGHVEGQWRRWGEPPILWIDGGHMTFPLHVGAITERIDGFRRGLSAS